MTKYDAYIFLTDFLKTMKDVNHEYYFIPKKLTESLEIALKELSKVVVKELKAKGSVPSPRPDNY